MTRLSRRWVLAQADRKILDPVWTTAYITRNHGYLVYDTLFGKDESFHVKPQMVDRTTVSSALPASPAPASTGSWPRASRRG